MDEHDSPRPAGAPVEQALRDLSDAVQCLRDEVAGLRDGIAREVRTERVVVVEPGGFERIELTARARFGHVTVRGRTPDGASSCAELFATDPVDGDGAHVGVALTAAGDVVAMLDVLEGGAGQLWFDPVVVPGADPIGLADDAD